MSADRAGEVRALAVELEDRDAAVAEEIAVVVELTERAGAVRSRAVEIREGVQALPGQIEGVERAEGEARTRQRDAQAELAEAQRRLDQIMESRRSSDEEQARARRVVQDAREAVSDAGNRVERLAEQRAELRDLAQALRAEAEGLAVEARNVAAALRDAPRLADAGKSLPGASLDEIDDWGGRARATLFVALGALETERERIVAEANALAASVLGEDHGAASVALARQRIEAALET
jgi:chromosome segregation ATPase